MTRSFSAACFLCMLISAAAIAQRVPPEAPRPVPPAPAAPAPAAPAAVEPPPAKDSKFSLTVYSTADPATFDPQAFAQDNEYNSLWMRQFPGYGVVRETRKIDLKSGENTVRFTDVAAGIDPTTVSFKSLTSPGDTGVLEQNFEYDLVSSEKLLRKYLDKRVVIVRKAADGKSAETIQGTLLSVDREAFVIGTDDKDHPTQIIPRGADIMGIRLAQLDTGLITKPTLMWKITTEKAGPHDAQISYQTDGLTWRADYSVMLNAADAAADVGAWVSIMNESGLSYPESHLKLIAGDVRKLTGPMQAIVGGNALGFTRAKQEGFEEKPFFEFHLYTLSRTTSLPNHSTKQIELFPTRQNVPLEKTLVYYGAMQPFGPYDSRPHTEQDFASESNKKVDIYMLLTNSQKSQMGIPLPAGRVRVYKKDDADGSLEFVGEDLIQHTAKDEKVLIRLGSAFDVVGERKQTDFTIDERAHVMTESFEIALRNHKKDPVQVMVRENLYRTVNWEITKSSEKWDKHDFRTIHIPVEIKPDQEVKVAYTVKYTW